METAKGEMLIAAPARWDEACFVLPAVRAVKAMGLVTGVLCAAEQADLWNALPGVMVVPFEAKKSADSLRGNWEAAILWEAGNFADACKRAGIPRRIGPAEKRLAKLLTHPVEISSAPGPVRHRVTHYLSLVSQLGMPVDLPGLFLPVMAAAPQTRTVMLVPDSDFGANHEWPLERWREIGGRMTGNGWTIAVAGLLGGRGLGQKLAVELAVEPRMFAAHLLGEAISIFAAHEKVVVADGSLSHLAAMSGTTCLTLFGPNDPAWKRPLGRKHGVVRRHVECAPCLAARCAMDMRCQNELRADAVWERFAALQTADLVPTIFPCSNRTGG
ncbi:MAG: glycosyltransferase family 9 protein [Verrucomicrobiota bacterium]